MSAPHLPWLEAAILVPLLGALVVGRLRDETAALRWCLGCAGLTLFCTLGAWLDFAWFGPAEGGGQGALARWLGGRFPVIDAFSAPLLPLMSLLHLLTAIATLRV